MGVFIRVAAFTILLLGINELIGLYRGSQMLKRAHVAKAYQIASMLARTNQQDMQIGLLNRSGDFRIKPPKELLEGSAVRRLDIEQSGAIRIELDERSGVDGGILLYLPLMEGGRIQQWKCVTRDYPEIESYIPACEFRE